MNAIKKAMTKEFEKAKMEEFVERRNQQAAFV